MCAFSYKRDHHMTKICSGHTIRTTIVENRMLNANFVTLCLIEWELFLVNQKLMKLGRNEFYTAGIGIFDLFGSHDLDLDPMTFIYELDPYSLEI